MKKFIEFFKNARNFIKVLQFISEALTAVAEVYNKHFPQENEAKRRVDERPNHEAKED